MDVGYYVLLSQATSVHVTAGHCYPWAVLSLEQGLMILLLSVEDGRGLLRAVEPGDQRSRHCRALCH